MSDKNKGVKKVTRVQNNASDQEQELAPIADKEVAGEGGAIEKYVNSTAATMVARLMLAMSRATAVDPNKAHILSREVIQDLSSQCSEAVATLIKRSALERDLDAAEEAISRLRGMIESDSVEWSDCAPVAVFMLSNPKYKLDIMRRSGRVFSHNKDHRLMRFVEIILGYREGDKAEALAHLAAEMVASEGFSNRVVYSRRRYKGQKGKNQKVETRNELIKDIFSRLV